jgi:hypothetical protein
MIHGDIAVIPGTIINHHLLTQPLAEALKGRPPDRVHASTWREAEDDGV